MPDCARCNRPLGADRARCPDCGACEQCCSCGSTKDVELYGQENRPELPKTRKRGPKRA